MTYQLPRLPDTVRTLRDDESKHLRLQFPGLPKSLKDCPTCQGMKVFRWYKDYSYDEAKEVVEYECSCADQIRLFNFFLHAGMGHSYQVLSWADVDQHLFDQNGEAVDAIADYWQAAPHYLARGFGLMLHGGYGTGKTLLASLLLKRLLTHGRGVDGFFITYNTLLDRYAAGWSDNEQAAWFERRIVNADVLIIDDIGKESSGRAGISRPALDNMIRSRVQNDRATIFTTNHTMAQFRNLYAGSTWSLLAEKVLPFEIKGSYKDESVGFRDQQLARNKDELHNRIIRPIVWS